MTTLSEADALDGLRDALGLLKGPGTCGPAAARRVRQALLRPGRELDWDAPFEEGKWFWPPELCRCTAPRCGGG
ncbi:hypothetical protein GCM10023238_20080 [Streptomyces heliomycini]